LFLLDLLLGEIFSLLPLNDSSFALYGEIILQNELFLELLVLEEWILCEGHDNLKVVGTLLINDMDVMQELESLLIVVGDLFL